MTLITSLSERWADFNHSSVNELRKEFGVSAKRLATMLLPTRGLFHTGSIRLLATFNRYNNLINI